MQSLLEQAVSDDYRSTAQRHTVAGNTFSAATVGRILRQNGQRAEQVLFGAAATVAQTAPAAANPPELLIISADGSRYRTNEADKRKKQPKGKKNAKGKKPAAPGDQGWRENKIGVVIRAAPGRYEKDGTYTPAAEMLKTYVASTANIDTFGHMLHVEAERRGLAVAKVVLFLSDNGHGLPDMRAREFPGAQVITDFYHVSERLSACAAAILGDGAALEKERRRLWHKLRDLLWRGQRSRLIELLSKEAAARAERPEHLTDLSGNPPAQTLWTTAFYLEKYQATMDYPAYRAQGWPIGSGTIESACGQFGNRFKHARMRWTRETANAGHQIKAEILSEDGRWPAQWPPPIPVLAIPA